MKKTIKTFIFAIGISTCISACSADPKLINFVNNENMQEDAKTCLVDFIDPQDREGFVDEFELQAIINGYEKTWASQNFRRVDSFYSESNHLYIMDGDCPFVLDLNIENIEPSTFYSVPAPSLLEEVGHKDYSTSNFPNDPLYKHQWNFEKLDMEKTWKNSKQGEGVIVAVIDTGVAYKNYQDHAALEDLNHTKFTKGVTFSSGLPDGLDDHSHGSHVAGTIAQSTNNGLGVAGIAPKATIMPLKVLSAQGYGSVEDIASAIRYATDNGAKVINMSLGGPQRSKIMEDAVFYIGFVKIIVPRFEQPCLLKLFSEKQDSRFCNCTNLSDKFETFKCCHLKIDQKLLHNTSCV
jgi:serine protease